MHILPWNDKESLEIIIKYILQNRVILAQTDTVLGLLAPANQQGWEALKSIKRRPADKPYLVQVADLKMVKELVEPAAFNALKKFLEKCWPGPVTFIMAAASGWQNAAAYSVALRWGNYEPLNNLIGQTGPLFSTSANISGQPVPQKVEEVDPSILAQVSCLVVDNIREVATIASTIIDLTKGFVVVREGSFPVKALEELYKKYVK